MEFNIFHEFVTLATRGSFVSAARELNMSQPALSRHIDAFEKQLKQKLVFDTRPLSLTPAGEVVLQYAGKLIHDYRTMLIELKELPSSEHESIVIQDLLHSSTLYIGINEAIKAAHEAFGFFKQSYMTADNSGLTAIQLIEKELVDISFETTLNTDEVTTLALPEGLSALVVPEFHSELTMGIPLDSPLATKEELSLKDLASERFILRMDRVGKAFTRDFIDLCESEGFYPNISFIPSNNTIEFYAADPRGGIHLLGAGNQEYRKLTIDLISKYAVERSFTDKKYYCNAFAIMRTKSNNMVLSFIYEFLKEKTEQFLDENGIDSEAAQSDTMQNPNTHSTFREY